MIFIFFLYYFRFLKVFLNKEELVLLQKADLGLLTFVRILLTSLVKHKAVLLVPCPSNIRCVNRVTHATMERVRAIGESSVELAQDCDGDRPSILRSKAGGFSPLVKIFHS